MSIDPETRGTIDMLQEANLEQLERAAHSTTAFTVRWEYESGHILRHRLFDTDEVNVAFDNHYHPGGRPETTPPPKLGIYDVPDTGVVVVGNPYMGAESLALAFGMVYVMNRDGKTVAKYKLGQVPVASAEAIANKPEEGDQAELNTQHNGD